MQHFDAISFHFTRHQYYVAISFQSQRSFPSLQQKEEAGIEPEEEDDVCAPVAEISVSVTFKLTVSIDIFNGSLGATPSIDEAERKNQ
ncbi:hypothetical protein L484_016104 [Morus notabilis]|uniref:Uncharacterized protein n=1 Tax=Morus notabilis TaxID=981085 RepID=W9RYK6_9ROSA|nr:hypothetical protein L484_016104 [Morus notabilis]